MNIKIKNIFLICLFATFLNLFINSEIYANECNCSNTQEPCVCDGCENMGRKDVNIYQDLYEAIFKDQCTKSGPNPPKQCEDVLGTLDRFNKIATTKEYDLYNYTVRKSQNIGPQCLSNSGKDNFAAGGRLSISDFNNWVFNEAFKTNLFKVVVEKTNNTTPIEDKKPENPKPETETTSSFATNIDFDQVKAFGRYAMAIINFCNMDKKCDELDKFVKDSNNIKRLNFISNLYMFGSFIDFPLNNPDYTKTSEYNTSSVPGTISKLITPASVKSAMSSDSCSWITDPSRFLWLEVSKSPDDTITHCLDLFNKNPEAMSQNLITKCRQDKENAQNCNVITSLNSDFSTYYETMYYNYLTNLEFKDMQGLQSVISNKYTEWKNIDEEMIKSMLVFVNTHKKVIDERIKDSKEMDSNKFNNKNTYCSTKGGLAWILCPAASASASIADVQFKVIDEILQNPSSIFEKSDSNGVKEAITKTRNIANILLTIVLLIIIISYLTGFGLNNYTIKKMMPILFVSAISINISFYIVQILIDISNIAGSGIYKILTDFKNDSAINNVKWAGGGSSLSILATAGNIILELILVIISGAIAILATLAQLIILTARSAIMILVIITAPIGIVSAIIPGFKKVFEIWKKALIAILIIYPTIALFYGSGILASAISGAAALSENNFYLMIVSKLIAIVPMILSPIVIIKILSNISVIGSKIASIGMAITGFLSYKGLKNAYNKTSRGQYRQNLKQQNIQMALSGNYAGNKLRYKLIQKLFSKSSETEKINNDIYKKLEADSQNININDIDNYYTGNVVSNPITQTISQPWEKDVLMIMAYRREAIQNKNFDTNKFEIMMQNAKQNGATQHFLSKIQFDTIKSLNENRDWGSEGILKAHQETHNGFGYGNGGSLQENVVKQIEKELINTIVYRPEFKDKNLETQPMYSNSFKTDAAKKALLNVWNSGPEAREAIQKSINVSDPITQEEFYKLIGKN